MDKVLYVCCMIDIWPRMLSMDFLVWGTSYTIGSLVTLKSSPSLLKPIGILRYLNLPKGVMNVRYFWDRELEVTREEVQGLAGSPAWSGRCCRMGAQSCPWMRSSPWSWSPSGLFFIFPQKVGRTTPLCGLKTSSMMPASNNLFISTSADPPWWRAACELYPCSKGLTPPSCISWWGVYLYNAKG